MNIKITTTYKNVDEEWLQWWLEHNPFGIDPSKGKDALPHKFVTKHPSSEIEAVTITELCDGDQNL